MIEANIIATGAPLNGATLENPEDILVAFRLVRDDLENSQLEFVATPANQASIRKTFGMGIVASLKGIVLRGVVTIIDDLNALPPGEDCAYEFRLFRLGKEPETVGNGTFKRKELEKAKPRKEAGNAKSSPPLE